MENSGIDDTRIEADVYRSATTRQILKCTHYKRALRAYIYSYVALYEMALEEFFKDNQQLKEVCLKQQRELKLPVLRGASIECFNDRLMSLTRDYDEIIFVFDTNRDDSMKTATCDKRRQGKAPIQYHITDDINIEHIPMSRFLSHVWYCWMV